MCVFVRARANSRESRPRLNCHIRSDKPLADNTSRVPRFGWNVVTSVYRNYIIQIWTACDGSVENTVPDVDIRVETKSQP